MARCEVCGNDDDKSFEVIAAGERHVFDSFECAIHRMAPVCLHCGCRVIGHGAEVDGRLYCCAHCARAAGSSDAPTDRVDLAGQPAQGTVDPVDAIAAEIDPRSPDAPEQIEELKEDAQVLGREVDR